MWLSFIIKDNDAYEEPIKFTHEGKEVIVSKLLYTSDVWFEKIPKHIREKGIKTLVYVHGDGTHVSKDEYLSTSGIWMLFKWRWKWTKRNSSHK